MSHRATDLREPTVSGKALPENVLSAVRFAQKIMDRYTGRGNSPWRYETLIFLMRASEERSDNREKADVFLLAWNILRVFLEQRLLKSGGVNGSAVSDANVKRMLEKNLDRLERLDKEVHGELLRIYEDSNGWSRQEIKTELRRIGEVFEKELSRMGVVPGERAGLPAGSPISRGGDRMLDPKRAGEVRGGLITSALGAPFDRLLDQTAVRRSVSGGRRLFLRETARQQSDYYLQIVKDRVSAQIEAQIRGRMNAETGIGTGTGAPPVRKENAPGAQEKAEAPLPEPAAAIWRKPGAPGADLRADLRAGLPGEKDGAGMLVWEYINTLSPQRLIHLASSEGEGEIRVAAEMLAGIQDRYQALIAYQRPAEEEKAGSAALEALRKTAKELSEGFWDTPLEGGARTDYLRERLLRTAAGPAIDAAAGEISRRFLWDAETEGGVPSQETLRSLLARTVGEEIWEKRRPAGEERRENGRQNSRENSGAPRIFRTAGLPREGQAEQEGGKKEQLRSPQISAAQFDQIRRMVSETIFKTLCGGPSDLQSSRAQEKKSDPLTAASGRRAQETGRAGKTAKPEKTAGSLHSASVGLLQQWERMEPARHGGLEVLGSMAPGGRGTAAVYGHAAGRGAGAEHDGTAGSDSAAERGDGAAAAMERILSYRQWMTEEAVPGAFLGYGRSGPFQAEKKAESALADGDVPVRGRRGALPQEIRGPGQASEGGDKERGRSPLTPPLTAGAVRTPYLPVGTASLPQQALRRAIQLTLRQTIQQTVPWTTQQTVRRTVHQTGQRTLDHRPQQALHRMNSGSSISENGGIQTEHRTAKAVKERNRSGQQYTNWIFFENRKRGRFETDAGNSRFATGPRPREEGLGTPPIRSFASPVFRNAGFSAAETEQRISAALMLGGQLAHPVQKELQPAAGRDRILKESRAPEAAGGPRQGRGQGGERGSEQSFLLPDPIGPVSRAARRARSTDRVRERSLRLTARGSVPVGLRSGNTPSGQPRRGVGLAGELPSGNLQTNELRRGDLQSGDLGQGDLQSGDLRPGSLRSGDLRRGNLQSGDLRPGSLRSRDLRLGSLRSGDLQRSRGSGLDGSKGRMEMLKTAAESGWIQTFGTVRRQSPYERRSQASAVQGPGRKIRFSTGRKADPAETILLENSHGTMGPAEDRNRPPAAELRRRPQAEGASLVYAEGGKKRRETRKETVGRANPEEEVIRLETRIRQQEYAARQDRERMDELVKKIEVQTEAVERLAKEQLTKERQTARRGPAGERGRLSHKVLEQLKTELRMERLRSGLD